VNVVTEIEEAFAARWSMFGRWTQGELHDENGLLWVETPIKHLPYNGVIRTIIDGDGDAVLPAVIERYRARGVQFFWLVHPSASPRDLSGRLAAQGLQPVEDITGMSLELADWKGAAVPGAVYQEVLDDALLSEFHRLTTVYWNIPEDEAPLVAHFQRESGPGRAPGHRYLALVDGAPVAKGYLSLAGPHGVAAIYGMTTLPEARGRGIASGLTKC
jgi:GNAT superfamily N-acetyltransferase